MFRIVETPSGVKLEIALILVRAVSESQIGRVSFQARIRMVRMSSVSSHRVEGDKMRPFCELLETTVTYHTLPAIP